MRTIIALVLAVAAILFSVKFTSIDQERAVTTYNDLYRTTTSYAVIQDNYKEYKEVEEEVVEEKKPEPEINKHLDKATDDYLGSIEIPALDISDAIYKSVGDFYLSHDFKKKPYEPGEIYLDDRTGDSLLETSALLNGHAVPDGTKFGNFKKLLDIEEQPKILIWDEKSKQVATYKMLFVSLIDGQNSGIVMKFDTEEQRLSYYKNLYSTSIKKWEEPVMGDTFLLLNSCAYIIDDGHYVVIAKKED